MNERSPGERLDRFIKRFYAIVKRDINAKEGLKLSQAGDLVGAQKALREAEKWDARARKLGPS